jgi:hypothetical protein
VAYEKDLKNAEVSKKEAREALDKTKGFVLMYEDNGQVTTIGSLSSLTDIEVYGLLAMAKEVVSDKLKEAV